VQLNPLHAAFSTVMRACGAARACLSRRISHHTQAVTDLAPAEAPHSSPRVWEAAKVINLRGGARDRRTDFTTASATIQRQPSVRPRDDRVRAKLVVLALMEARFGGRLFPKRVTDGTISFKSASGESALWRSRRLLWASGGAGQIAMYANV
jgi:hypothetical protein